MTTYRFVAGEDDRNCRIDVFVCGKAPELTRSAAEKLFTKGYVLVNGGPVKKNHRLSCGELVTVQIPDPAPAEARPEDIPLDVVYEDADVIVINKPRGMVVHPAAGNPDGTLVNALLARCGDSLSGVGGCRRPGIVHRIDKDTSGLLVAAKNDRAHLSLAGQFKDKTAGRIYEAVVVGRLKEKEGVIDAPIGRHKTHRKKMAIDPDGRPAVTHFEIIAEYPGYTHVRCRLETGRTHQIRVHFASIGHPVAGDPLYGPKKDATGLAAQCLHAAELHFTHPATGEPMRFAAEKPRWFADFLEKLSRR